jgi:UDP:flavonoid glycosyltransferase YjiC (YdhE family)
VARFHLCWELGGGLGHAGRLKLLAAALLARGHEVSVSLRDVAQAQGMFAGLNTPVLQAPLWLHEVVGLPPDHGNHAEILMAAGYWQPAPLAGLVDAWRGMFSLLRPDVVVADYAPTAILAARSMGVRSASVGSAFSMPPAGQALPPLRGWENIPPQRLAAAEAHVLQTANAVLAHHQAPLFACAADLLAGDAQLLTTWPELDHYERLPAPSAPVWLGPAFLPAGGAEPVWPAGDGPKVFAYLKAAHASHADVLRALAQEGCRVLCYLPEVASGKTPPVSAPNVSFARGPVALQAALAEAQLCVTHAGEATLAQAMLAGVPVLMLPMQLEQFHTARRIAGAGMGVNAAMLGQPVAWREVVRHMLGTPGYAAAAQAFAQRARGYQVDAMAARVAGLLEDIAA